jgi:hypothetical protein
VEVFVDVSLLLSQQGIEGMKPVLPRTLEEMALRRTRYEVELAAGGKRRVIGYTARKTLDVLMRYAREHREEILLHIGDSENVWFTARNGGIDINDTVSVRFTGRTERDARSELDRAAGKVPA